MKKKSKPKYESEVFYVNCGMFSVVDFVRILFPHEDLSPKLWSKVREIFIQNGGDVKLFDEQYDLWKKEVSTIKHTWKD